MNFMIIGSLVLLCSMLPFRSSAQLMTVKGPIPTEEIGLTLIHEHILVDWIGADSTGYHRWNRTDVVSRALPYLQKAKEYGLTTFLDCTPAYLGRDPYVLKMLSDRTGIHIVTNTGYYGAQNNKFVPKTAFSSSAEEIADIWVKEFEVGIDSSGIVPGFIKISVDKDGKLSTFHEKLVRAAALTHVKTGLTIVSHTGPDAPAMAQIEILEKMGVSPRAFVWTHAQNGTMEGYIKAAKRGAWISLDNVSSAPERIEWYVEVLSELKEKQLLSQILISHDSGWYHVGQVNGGNFKGYTPIFSEVVPRLKKRGFSAEDIKMLLIENPKRAYSLQVRKL